MTIINPWLFYLIELFNNLRIVSVLVCFIAAMLIVAFILVYDDEKDLKIIKLLIYISISCISILILTPTKETCYKMLVSSVVTTDNIDNATEIIKNNVDYIFDKFNEE